MGVDYYSCGMCDECVHCQMYECKEGHSICRYCVNDHGLALQAHYYDDEDKKWVYEDYNEDEHEWVEKVVVKDCSLCKSKEGENTSMKKKIDEIVGKHCKRNKQKLCKELYDILCLRIKIPSIGLVYRENDRFVSKKSLSAEIYLRKAT